MPARKTTIRDIAERLSVTPSTVSRALQDNARISQAMRTAVRETAAAMNYQPNTIASALRSGKSYIIGVVLPCMNRGFFASVIQGIETVATEAGYQLMLTQYNNDPEVEKTNVQTLMRAQVDGIIASMSARTSDLTAYQGLRERGLPLVLFDRVADVAGASQVVIDDYRGGYEATTHLIEQGCTSIVHLGGDPELNIYRDRAAGYRQALADHGLSHDPTTDLIRMNQSVEDGKRIGRQLLERETLPDGIFSASDWGAVGAMSVLRAAGVAVPDRVAVVGFANEPFTEFVEPPLTSVDQFSEEIGRRAALAFLDQVAGGTQTTPERHVLPPRLVVRKSSLRHTD